MCVCVCVCVCVSKCVYVCYAGTSAWIDITPKPQCDEIMCFERTTNIQRRASGKIVENSRMNIRVYAYGGAWRLCIATWWCSVFLSICMRLLATQNDTYLCPGLVAIWKSICWIFLRDKWQRFVTRQQSDRIHNTCEENTKICARSDRMCMQNTRSTFVLAGAGDAQ